MNPKKKEQSMCLFNPFEIKGDHLGMSYVFSLGAIDSESPYCSVTLTSLELPSSDDCYKRGMFRDQFRWLLESRGVDCTSSYQTGCHLQFVDKGELQIPVISTKAEKAVPLAKKIIELYCDLL